MCFIQDGEHAAALANALVSRDLFDVHTLSGNDIVAGHMIRRGFDRVVIENVRRQAVRHESRHVVGIVRVGAWLAPFYRDSAFGVCAGHVGGKVQVEQFLSHGTPIWGRATWTDREDFERARPVER